MEFDPERLPRGAVAAMHAAEGMADSDTNIDGGAAPVAAAFGGEFGATTLSIPSTLTIAPMEAFTPSPKHKPVSFGADGSLFDSMDRCPLSSRCTDDVPREELISHLKNVHSLTEHQLAACGLAQIAAPLRIDDSSRRQQSVLFHFENSSFLWCFQSRLRADCEVMASVTIQMLPAPSSTDDLDVHVGATGNSSAVRVETDDIESSTSPQPKYKVSLTVEKVAGAPADAVAPKWEGEMDGEEPVQRHEHVISCGKGIVVLYPTQQEFFFPGRDAGTKQISVITHIERLS